MLTCRGKVLLTLFAGPVLAAGCATVPPAAENGVELANGLWWTGDGFESRRLYEVGGFLTSDRPQHIDLVLDLGSGYVVPPFAEAHNHNVTNPPREDELAKYARDGIFYVMIQNNLAPEKPIDAPPTKGVEVTFANGGLTHPQGHVVELNRKLLGWGVYPGLTEAELEGRVFHTIDSLADLETKWSRVVASSPDFVKVFLGFSSEYGRREGNPGYFGKVGLAPEILRPIVERAHAEGLRVSAHIETAADFRLAVDAGVDIVAHLPGWRIGRDAGFEDRDNERWILSDEDARHAASAGVAVITTVLAGETSTNPDHENFATVWEDHRRNIDTLRRAGVTVAIGSDYYEGTSVAEAFVLSGQPLAEPLPALGAFDNRDLLRAWCTTTSQVIFPRRKIGVLDDGYEASFLVLDGDPVADFVNVRRIRLRVKRGNVLEVGAPPEAP